MSHPVPRVRLVRRRHGRPVTVVERLDPAVDRRDLAEHLRASGVACSVAGDRIVARGDRRDRVLAALRERALID